MNVHQFPIIPRPIPATTIDPSDWTAACDRVLDRVNAGVRLARGEGVKLARLVARNAGEIERLETAS